ncbi:MAG TPA: hypothetical protein VNJ03_03705 [Vicinamibacterales bacterium]|nr:hypothetical protein [Vicinamibacterales bacterium]
MPITGMRSHLVVLAGYVCVALAFCWPLPLHLGTALLGPVSGDTGVYVWNLWVFRHEILSHNFPFLTTEVMPLGPSVPLTLHNYTTAANIVAYFFLPLLGTVAVFNLLTILSPVLAAYMMFLLARRLSDDPGASWVAGLAFGFCPFLNARAMEHFSLVQAAPLPLFVLLFERLRVRPGLPLAAATGATVAWAFLSDPYYAVYCLLIAAVTLVTAMLSVRFARRDATERLRWTVVLDLALVCLAGLIAGIVIRGGGTMDVFGLRVSMTRLYNPVMAATILILVRLALWLRPTFAWVSAFPPVRVVLTLAVTCAVIVAPVLGAMGTRLAERNSWVAPPVLWRSSAPGLDLLSFFLPNPLHPLVSGAFDAGLSSSPGGLVENVASIPWTVILIIVIGIVYAGTRFPRRWIIWTGFFALLALGPFITIAGVMTYVPTPWTLVRYVPVVGAARMPQRVAILVMLGVSILAVYALRDLRLRARRPWMVTVAATVLLLLETLPAPRTLHSAAVPSVYRIIAEDPRAVRVLNLPFGLRDGLGSHGNTNAASQYYQTVHEKPIMGGYLSRLPTNRVARYRRRRVMSVLLELSEGRPVALDRQDRAVVRAWENRAEHNIGYVVMDSTRCSPELSAFAERAFDLTFVAADGPFRLYRAWSSAGS